MKKRKLNSKNPKYFPKVKKEEIKQDKILINDTGNAKVFAVYTRNKK
jgi:hypothetical protein|tara:strand:+ start:1070 stop:1210 length:141 start_codon:yes stop_codon:yes gene_type:complete